MGMKFRALEFIISWDKSEKGIDFLLEAGKREEL